LERDVGNYELQQSLKRACYWQTTSEDIDQPVKMWEDVLQLKPDDPGLQRRVVESYLHKGGAKETIQLCRKFVIQSSDHWWLLEHLDEAYQEIGDFTQAVEDWTFLLKHKPGDKALLQKLAEANERIGRYDAAIKVWEELVVRDPTNWSLRESLDESYKGKGALDQAIRWWQGMLIRYDPSDFDIQWRLNKAYQRKDNADDAIMGWKGLLSRFPQNKTILQQFRKATELKNQPNLKMAKSDEMQSFDSLKVKTFTNVSHRV